MKTNTTKKTVSLVEAYKNRLTIAESVYKKEHEGKSLSESKKLIIAKVLNTTNKFLTESFEQAQGTQLSAMGDYKKFCLDLTNIALPNLIAMDLVMVSPMKTHTGYVQYLRFVAGTDKGGITEDPETLFNDPFKLGEMTDARIDYTGNSVVEPIASFTSGTTAVAFKTGATFVDALDENGASVVDKTGTAWTIDATSGVITAGAYASGKSATDVAKIAYVYNNTIIPQDTIPTVKAVMDGISLKAKARRIAIYYSQLAQYTLKVETGADLGELLKGQAINEIQYEIDTEVIKLLRNSADTATTEDELAEVTFNKRLPIGVGIKDHFYGFLNVLDKASAIIYNRTQKYEANFMVCARNVISILAVLDAWKPSGDKKVGPYYAGSLNGVKVYVSPFLGKKDKYEFFLGFNDGDLATSPAVYAPFMAIVPTQLIGMPDSSMQQGFATMYDLKALPGNQLLLVKGQIVDEPYPVELTDGE